MNLSKKQSVYKPTSCEIHFKSGVVSLLRITGLARQFLGSGVLSFTVWVVILKTFLPTTRPSTPLCEPCLSFRTVACSIPNPNQFGVACTQINCQHPQKLWICETWRRGPVDTQNLGFRFPLHIGNILYACLSLILSRQMHFTFSLCKYHVRPASTSQPVWSSKSMQ